MQVRLKHGVASHGGSGEPEAALPNACAEAEPRALTDYPSLNADPARPCLFAHLQKSTVQVWLYDNTSVRMEGVIVVRPSLSSSFWLATGELARATSVAHTPVELSSMGAALKLASRADGWALERGGRGAWPSSCPASGLSALAQAQGGTWRHGPVSSAPASREQLEAPTAGWLGD